MDAPPAPAEQRGPPVPDEFAGFLPPALAELNVPAYVIDEDGIIRWLNPACEAIVGHAEGRPFTDIVAADSDEAQKAFARRLDGTDTADQSVPFVGPDGEETKVEVSSVRLASGHHVVGMFGLAVPRERRRPPVRDSPLTPRQHEVLMMLADGYSTTSMAQELFLSEETIRNHVRQVLRRLNTNSRLAAVAAARPDGLV